MSSVEMKQRCDEALAWTSKASNSQFDSIAEPLIGR
jgi:hypothetical protein